MTRDEFMTRWGWLASHCCINSGDVEQLWLDFLAAQDKAFDDGRHREALRYE